MVWWYMAVSLWRILAGPAWLAAFTLASTAVRVSHVDDTVAVSSLTRRTRAPIKAVDYVRYTRYYDYKRNHGECVMEKEALEQVQQMLNENVKARFPEGVIEEVRLLQYGDDPVVEPGQIVVRVIAAASADEEDRHRVARKFEGAFRQQLDELREDMGDKLPQASRIEIRIGSDLKGPRFFMARPGPSSEKGPLIAADLTPVMARLGPVDLETLDTLITAGIAGSRADAVRWALARIRERPAYAQLRAKSAEIEELKSQF
jgi:hypothetical protein